MFHKTCDWVVLLSIFSLKFEKINQNHANKDLYAKDTNKSIETYQGNGKQWKMVCWPD